MKGYYIRYVPCIDEYQWYMHMGTIILVLKIFDSYSEWMQSLHDEITEEFEFVCDIEGNETPEGYYFKELFGFGYYLYRYMNGELVIIDEVYGYVKSGYASPEKEHGFTFAFDLELKG